jgi:hypothetical protein
MLHSMSVFAVRSKFVPLEMLQSKGEAGVKNVKKSIIGLALKSLVAQYPEFAVLTKQIIQNLGVARTEEDGEEAAGARDQRAKRAQRERGRGRARERSERKGRGGKGAPGSGASAKGELSRARQGAERAQ